MKLLMALENGIDGMMIGYLYSLKWIVIKITKYCFWFIDYHKDTLSKVIDGSVG